ncbi:MAG: glycogen synthase [Pseudomonadota bacterium]
MKVCFFTKEYPPQIYGGAGVHVKNLTRQLSRLIDVEVRCMGDQRSDEPQLAVHGFGAWNRMWEGHNPKFNSALGTFSTNLSMVRDAIDADLVHSHTWYAALSGYMAQQLYQVPYVATVHSLEPLRPWKEEQLGRSYHLTTWVEKVALEAADRIVAVSNHAKGEILEHFDVDQRRIRVIHNGIDLDVWTPSASQATRRAYEIEGPYILFVGRTSRQKGMVHLIDAMQHVDPGVRLVCCTSAPDTPEIEQEIAAKIAQQPRALWINTMLREDQYIELYTHASVFCCPSVYEPFGIINLEAMACETPVVASAVGGIQEVVVDGTTGFQVPPGDAQALARRINDVLRDPALALRMGKAGRQRVVDHFSWASIASKTLEMYQELVDEKKP